MEHSVITNRICHIPLNAIKATTPVLELRREEIVKIEKDRKKMGRSGGVVLIEFRPSHTSSRLNLMKCIVSNRRSILGVNSMALCGVVIRQYNRRHYETLFNSGMNE